MKSGLNIHVMAVGVKVNYGFFISNSLGLNGLLLLYLTRFCLKCSVIHRVANTSYQGLKLYTVSVVISV